jgi:hypothetical protein
VNKHLHKVSFAGFPGSSVTVHVRVVHIISLELSFIPTAAEKNILCFHFLLVHYIFHMFPQIKIYGVKTWIASNVDYHN